MNPVAERAVHNVQDGTVQRCWRPSQAVWRPNKQPGTDAIFSSPSASRPRDLKFVSWILPESFMYDSGLVCASACEFVDPPSAKTLDLYGLETQSGS